MKRIATILLLLLLPGLYTGSQVVAATGSDIAKVCMLNDKQNANISKLANILDQCCFEVHESSNTLLTRHTGHSTPRCPFKHLKAGSLIFAQYKQKNSIPSGENSQKAIAASRHTHGYYIYALRHIII